MSAQCLVITPIGLYEVRYQVGSGGGEGTLAPLTPYGMSNWGMSIKTDREVAIFNRLVKREEIEIGDRHHE